MGDVVLGGFGRKPGLEKLFEQIRAEYAESGYEPEAIQYLMEKVESRIKSLIDEPVPVAEFNYTFESISTADKAGLTAEHTRVIKEQFEYQTRLLITAAALIGGIAGDVYDDFNQ